MSARISFHVIMRMTVDYLPRCTFCFITLFISFFVNLFFFFNQKRMKNKTQTHMDSHTSAHSHSFAFALKICIRFLFIYINVANVSECKNSLLLVDRSVCFSINYTFIFITFDLFNAPVYAYMLFAHFLGDF